MATPAENPIILNLESSYGSLLIGCFLSCTVWGMTTLQIFWYFYNIDTDSKFRRALVLILWFIDITSQILILKPMWPVLITQWGRVAGLSEIRGEMVHHSWVSGIIAASVQIFYLHRIYCYNGRKWVAPVVIGIIALYQPLVAIPYMIILNQDYVYSNLGSKRLTILNISLRATSAAVDIFTAATMSHYLFKSGIPKYRNTRKMYMRLFVLTINTGIWTAVIATVDLFLMATANGTLHYTILEWPLGSLYLSVLLVNLNSRDYVRGTPSTNVWNDSPARVFQLNNVSSRLDASSSSSRNLPSQKDTVVMIDIESNGSSGDDKIKSQY